MMGRFEGSRSRRLDPQGCRCSVTVFITHVAVLNEGIQPCVLSCLTGLGKCTTMNLL